jgi:hypothetical protein
VKDRPSGKFVLEHPGAREPRVGRDGYAVFTAGFEGEAPFGRHAAESENRRRALLGEPPRSRAGLAVQISRRDEEVPSLLEGVNRR